MWLVPLECVSCLLHRKSNLSSSTSPGHPRGSDFSALTKLPGGSQNDAVCVWEGRECVCERERERQREREKERESESERQTETETETEIETETETETES